MQRWIEEYNIAQRDRNNGVRPTSCDIFCFDILKGERGNRGCVSRDKRVTEL